LEEEDEHDTSMTPLQKEDDNEDITHSDTHAAPPTIVQGPITAQMRQLNLQLSLFLSYHFHSYENRLQANDVIILRKANDVIILTNMREDHKALAESHGGTRTNEAFV